MKKLGAGAAILLMLVMANVVGGGVFLVLGPLAQSIGNEDLQLAALGVVGVLSIGSALCFLSGSLRAVVASLQSRPQGQRGG